MKLAGVEFNRLCGDGAHHARDRDAGIVWRSDVGSWKAVWESSAHDAADNAAHGSAIRAGAHSPRRATLEVIKRAFEAAGVEFIDENGGGPGVRLRKRQLKRGKPSDSNSCA